MASIWAYYYRYAGVASVVIAMLATKYNERESARDHPTLHIMVLSLFSLVVEV